MNRQLSHFLAMLLASTTAFAQTVPSLGGGRLAEWVPRNEIRLETGVYLGRNLLPTVSYSTEFVRQHPPEYVKFSILRQDVVAFLASDILRRGDAYSTPLDAPDLAGFPAIRVRTGQFIPESSVYTHKLLKGSRDLALDCLAYHGLTPKEREALADYANRRIVDPPRIPGSIRTLTASTISWANSETCKQLSAEFLK